MSAHFKYYFSDETPSERKEGRSFKAGAHYIFHVKSKALIPGSI